MPMQTALDSHRSKSTTTFMRSIVLLSAAPRTSGNPPKPGVRDHVVLVMATAVERTAAGDEPQLRIGGVAVDALGRELRLRVALHPVCLEHRLRPVRPHDGHLVARGELGQPVEDAGYARVVDVARDHGGA